LDDQRNDRKSNIRRSFVDYADDVTHVWSPTDALAYCMVLQKNIERRKNGGKLLIPDLDSMLFELLLKPFR
jgi:hypothetical protein